MKALAGAGLFATVFALRPDWRVGEQVVVNNLLVDPKAEQRASWRLLDSGEFDGFPAEGLARRVLIVADSHSKDIFDAMHLNTENWPDTVFRRTELNRRCRDTDASRIIESCLMHREEVIAGINLRLRGIADDLGIPFLEKEDYMCPPPGRTCTAMTPDGAALIYDYGHYTLTGAAWFGARMADIRWLTPALGR